MGHKYPEEFKSKVVEAVIKGMPIKKASRFFDVERHTLQKWYRHAIGEETPTVKHWLTFEDKKKAIEQVKTGSSVIEVAKTFNVSEATIYNWIDKFDTDSGVYSEQDNKSKKEETVVVPRASNEKDIKVQNRNLKEENSFLKARVAYLEELMKLSNINADSFKKKLVTKQSTESLNEEKEL